MLKRIKIQGYKSLVDVEVSLEPLCRRGDKHRYTKGLQDEDQRTVTR